MKKVYMIHGWGESSEDSWFPWLKKELEKKKIKVRIFDMPESENPKIETWVKHLEENVKDVDENTYFIGHSIGCQTIMRFLEKMHKHKKIGGCIFVSGWFNLINLEPEEMKIAHPWLTSPVEFSRIIDHCNNFLAIFSRDDPYVPLEDSEIFREKLGARIFIEKNKGHFEEKIQNGILNETLKLIHKK